MTDRDRQRLDAILEAHLQAVSAFLRSRQAVTDTQTGLHTALAGVRTAIDGLERALTSIDLANPAQEAAIHAIMAANEAALTWLRSLKEE